jgi:hypothetical protein
MDILHTQITHLLLPLSLSPLFLFGCEPAIGEEARSFPGDGDGDGDGDEMS